MTEILSFAYELRNKITEWRRELHSIPELDLNLPQTQAYVLSFLEHEKIPYRTFERDSSICAWIKGTEGDRAVALRADMDALHIKEQTSLPYASKNGNMHACAHDAHTAMLMGAAAILTKIKDRFPGHVTLLFQAGEECSGGAKNMLDNGVLEKPQAGAIFGQHAGIMSSELEAGKFGFFPGKFMASRDSFNITIKGKSSHGSMPAQGIDPVTISAYLITALQSLISRECNGDESAVLTIGSIHGGEVYNIIPDNVKLSGAIRCISEEKRRYLEERIKTLSKNLCASMRAECEIEYEYGYPVTENDLNMTYFAANCAETLLGKDSIQFLHSPLMSSEDMSFFLQKCPGCFWLYSTPPSTGQCYPNHSSKFQIDDSILYKGSALMAHVAVEWLNRYGR